jgi:hypothetical protein
MGEQLFVENLGATAEEDVHLALQILAGDDALVSALAGGAAVSAGAVTTEAVVVAEEVVFRERAVNSTRSTGKTNVVKRTKSLNAFEIEIETKF